MVYTWGFLNFQKFLKNIFKVQTQMLAAAEAANKEREKDKDHLTVQRKEKELSVHSDASRDLTPAIVFF